MILTAIVSAIVAAAPAQCEITVYNQGFGLVKEIRKVSLKEGRQTVAIEDVAQLIDPSSVGFRSVGNSSLFNLLEQNYQYDLISPNAILNKSVGLKVRLTRTIANQKEVLEGTLISSPTSVVNSNEGGSTYTYNGLVIKTDDGRIVLNPTGEIEVQQVPAGLISKPTLLWELEAPKADDAEVELSYITKGLNWNADYVFTLDGKGKADVQGWVTMNNQSGASYNNAKLKLLAGDVNTVQNAPRALRGMAGGFTAEAKSSFQEESLFEYHLYTLQRPATIKDKESKQLSLLEGHDVPITKKLIIDSMQGWGTYYPSEGEVGTGQLKPQVRLEFVNDEKSGLGMPLPKGKVRFYQRDASGSVQLLGEDQINHTPRNEKVSLVVGRSFDVVGDRKRLSYSRLSSNSFRETFQMQVRNRKNTSETVYVLERHWGDWSVKDTSDEFKKLDSTTMQYVLTLKPNESKTITYTVDTKW